MKIRLLIIIVLLFTVFQGYNQSFTVDDLAALAKLPSKDIDHYLNKKGFVLSESRNDSNETHATFTCKIKFNKNAINPGKSIDICFKDNAKYFTLHTPDANEYQQGQQRLIKSKYFYDTLENITTEKSMLFQKANISIQATKEMQDSVMQYCFALKERSVPSSLTYADDLLQFDSHEFLVSFFGEQNVKKDMYFFTEKELKKCSVLFSGTPHQAVFVWGDDNNLSDLMYILVTNKLPTKGAEDANPLAGNNEWQLKCGIHPGMELKDLLKINETDFDIYGNKSEMAFLIKPSQAGKVDFRKAAVMLACHECFDNKIFNQDVVSALAVAKANLPMRVFDVALYPQKGN